MKPIIIFLLILVGFSSCMTQKTAHLGLKNYNTNNVKVIQQPHYKKKLTIIGKGTQVGAVVGGVIGAITVKPTMTYNEKNEQTSNNEANVVIGASVGYGITSLYYVMKGQGKKTYISSGNDFYEWLSKYNRKKRKNYVYTGFTANYGYLVLPNDAQTERNYVVNSLEDAIMFKNVFPYSKRMGEIEYQAYISLRNYNEALKFIQYFPNSKYAIHLKKSIEEEKAKCAKNTQSPSWESIGNAALGFGTLWCFLLGSDEYPNLCKAVSCILQYKVNTVDKSSIFSDPIAAAALIEFGIIPYIQGKKSSNKTEFDTFYNKLKKFSIEQSKSAAKDLEQDEILKGLREQLNKKGYTEASKALSDDNVANFKALFSLIKCITD